jgi:hypothetical protein
MSGAVRKVERGYLCLSPWRTASGAALVLTLGDFVGATCAAYRFSTVPGFSIGARDATGPDWLTLFGWGLLCGMALMALLSWWLFTRERELRIPEELFPVRGRWLRYLLGGVLALPVLAAIALMPDGWGLVTVLYGFNLLVPMVGIPWAVMMLPVLVVGGFMEHSQVKMPRGEEREDGPATP